MEADGEVRVVTDSGEVLFSHEVAAGDIWRACQTKDSAVRDWVKQAEAEESPEGTGALSSAEREELKRLRKQAKTLETEREILKKATAFFAKESRRGSGSSTRSGPATRSRFSAVVCGSRGQGTTRGSDVLRRDVRSRTPSSEWRSRRRTKPAAGPTEARGSTGICKRKVARCRASGWLR